MRWDVTTTNRAELLLYYDDDDDDDTGILKGLEDALARLLLRVGCSGINGPVCKSGRATLICVRHERCLQHDHCQLWLIVLFHSFFSPANGTRKAGMNVEAQATSINRNDVVQVVKLHSSHHIIYILRVIYYLYSTGFYGKLCP